MDIKEVGPYLISFLGLLITAYVAIRGRKKERAETEKLNEERGKISSETEKISAETLSTQLRALSERVDAMSMDLAAYAGYIRYLLEGIRKNTRWKPMEFYEWVQANPASGKTSDMRFRWPGGTPD